MRIAEWWIVVICGDRLCWTSVGCVLVSYIFPFSSPMRRRIQVSFSFLFIFIVFRFNCHEWSIVVIVFVGCVRVSYIFWLYVVSKVSIFRWVYHCFGFGTRSDRRVGCAGDCGGGGGAVGGCSGGGILKRSIKSWTGTVKTRAKIRFFGESFAWGNRYLMTNL